MKILILIYSSLLSINNTGVPFFLLGGDYYILRGEERPKDAAHSGHYVVCSGIRDGKFVIHDPGPDIKMEYLVDKDTLYKAIKYY